MIHNNAEVGNMFKFFMMLFAVVVGTFGFAGNVAAEENETSDGWEGVPDVLLY